MANALQIDPLRPLGLTHGADGPNLLTQPQQTIVIRSSSGDPVSAVLQIAPFVIGNPPTSGGEVRISEFALAYRQAGCTLDRTIVHVRRAPQASARDVKLGWWDRQRRSHVGKPYGLTNLRQMWALRASDRYARWLDQRLTGHYDLIQVEHPWDFDLALQLRTLGACAGARIAYSAHNIESHLQELVWRANGQWTSAAERLIEEIRVHEARAARDADISWATSDADAHFLLQQGAGRVVVVPNGVAPLAPFDPEAAVPRKPYLLFVASSHVPNVEGLATWLTAPLTDLPAGCSLVLAGSVGKVIHRDRRYQADFSSGRIVDAGVLPRHQLDQLIRHAHAIVLPIGTGGGTNLKSAEALASGRPVVSTQVGMRGFERFEDDDRLVMAETPEKFRLVALDLLRAPRRADLVDNKADSLLWSHALRGVWPALRELGLALPKADH